MRLRFVKIIVIIPYISMQNSKVVAALTDTQYEKLFHSLFTALFMPLAGYANKLVQDYDMAKDIVHNVFTTLWENRESTDFESPVKPYLYRSVHNRCLNALRDRKRTTEPTDFLLLPDSDPDQELMNTTELENRVHHILESLPEKCREVFRLSRFEELKYSEIADRLGISVKTVEAQMSKAIKVFREQLVDYLSWLLLAGMGLTKILVKNFAFA